ncbi:hypothetical protein GGI35DRAFT_213582 [Trichoderma velutinum]
MSGNKSTPVSTEKSGIWSGIPDDFAAPGRGYSSPPKRIRRRPARSPALQSEHGGPATAAAADPNNKNEHDEPIGAEGAVPPHADDHTNLAASGIAILDEQSYIREDTRMSEFESLKGEEGPASEDDEVSFTDVNNGVTGWSLSQELAAAIDQSDEEDEYNAATNDNTLPIDSLQSSRSISSDGEMDAASEAGNNFAYSINAESNQTPDANIDEILRERDFLKKQLESQDEKMAAMRRENAFLKEELESRNEVISAREAEIAALMKTTVKAIPSSDASTNTETPTGGVWQLNHPTEDDSEQEFISIKKPSPLLPVSSSGPQKATAVQFIRAFLVITKDLYFDFTEAVNMGSLLGQDLFLSCMSIRMSVSLMGTAEVFQKWARAAVIFLATPFWMLMSFSVYLSIQHEKNMWMQANALTRKQLLGHVSGAAGEWNWDLLFAVGSVMLYNRYL